MGFILTLFQRKEKSSASAAKDRLLEVLIHDRVKVTPATMEQIRQEIIAVLSKYIDIDREGMEVTLTRAEGSHQLTANIPIRRNDRFDRLAPADEDSMPKGGAGAAGDFGAVPRPSGGSGLASEASGRPERSDPSNQQQPRRAAPPSASSPPPQRFGPAPKKRHP